MCRCGSALGRRICFLQGYHYCYCCYTIRDTGHIVGYLSSEKIAQYPALFLSHVHAIPAQQTWYVYINHLSFACVIVQRISLALTVFRQKVQKKDAELKEGKNDFDAAWTQMPPPACTRAWPSKRGKKIWQNCRQIGRVSHREDE